MVARTASQCLVLAALLAGAGAPGALAKEDLRGRLETPIPLGAAAGETITVAWTLHSAAERGAPATGRAEPAAGTGGGASPMFVRLLSAGGGRPTEAYGELFGGRYVARIAVPTGGIGGVELGLQGTRYIGGGPGRGRAERADLLFPVQNDPFATAPRARRRTAASAETTSAGWAVPGLLIAGLGALAAALAARRAVVARRPRP